ncbi:PorP/SprF family type IX secretion system membrane protein [uncultured Microscilla sp.]|uniref:PorP/SprF family type IX secretion system membrane protein n=1 Tax=uncultured Microscilla sp. TaxID=432653 RepID=UPI00262DD8F4|nr:PorP/SprF family type IX secretion system membrane protein [uncultured Microscilla sp.]
MNYKCLLLSLFIFTLIVHNQLIAQTATYSQYHLSPMQTNPAMIGTYNQPLALMSYRQVSLGSGLLGSNTAFETPMISLLYPIKSKNKGRLGGTGFSVINDRAGGGGTLQTTGLQAGFAYNQQLGKTHYLSMGVQGGYFWQNLNTSQLTTGNQWVDGQFLGEIANNEAIGTAPVSFPTASAGLYWYFTNTDSTSDIKAYLGVSGQNLNRPDVSFNPNEKELLPINLVVTGGFTVFDNQTIKVMPNVRWVERVGLSRQINAGTLLWYQLGSPEDKPQTNVGLGMWYNSHGIANVSFEFNQPHYMVAIGYGFAATKSAPQVNTFEVKLGLKIGKPYVKNTFERKKRPKKIKVVPQEEKVVPVPSVATNKKAPAEKHLELLAKSVYFEYKKNYLINPAKAYLNQVVNVLKKYPEIKLEIQGHTCDISQSEANNQQLSEDRAQKVRAYLVKNGINAQRLTTTGFGSKQPAFPNDDYYNRVRNRRVQFKVIKDKK